MPKFGSEPKFEPELLRTGPKFSSKFSTFAEPNLKFSSRFSQTSILLNLFEPGSNLNRTCLSGPWTFNFFQMVKSSLTWRKMNSLVITKMFRYVLSHFFLTSLAHLVLNRNNQRSWLKQNNLHRQQEKRRIRRERLQNVSLKLRDRNGQSKGQFSRVILSLVFLQTSRSQMPSNTIHIF